VVRRTFGFALFRGSAAEKCRPRQKPLRDFARGVLELIENYDRNTYRGGLHSFGLRPRFNVLHVFQKKSKRGIATPRHEINMIRRTAERPG